MSDLTYVAPIVAKIEYPDTKSRLKRAPIEHKVVPIMIVMKAMGMESDQEEFAGLKVYTRGQALKFLEKPVMVFMDVWLSKTYFEVRAKDL
ncbi:unnamed protein product [Cuscuta campestris]|uniref:Uncharacterized protein n=1 Tax=Cuscuta campestris TaxID=132261 RepID=A0A484LNN8_9ASTE|nr:unnamed protein product [Cuscuta campestris]